MSGAAPSTVPTDRDEAPLPDHGAELASLVGASVGPPQLSPHAVNEAMIRHWVEAMGDENGAYVSDDVARRVGLDGVVAPPTMLQAWVMRGLSATLELERSRATGTAARDSANDRMMALLDDEGRTSVVATNCEQDYLRPLRIGDRVVASSVIEDITEGKRTGLGDGRFVTTRVDFVAVPDVAVGPDPDPAALAATGEPVATMRFRILKYRPRPAKVARPNRPRPAITPDNAFFFEGARQGKLAVQQCRTCGTLRHPPLPSCAKCRSFDWDPMEVSGRGELYSFVVVHYPQVPAFDYPLAIGLVALEEGTRLVADLVGTAPEDLWIGMPLSVRFETFDDELTLPMFAAADARPPGTPDA